MSIFYTNVHLFRNEVLVRAINSETGRRFNYRQPIQPTLYIPAKDSDPHNYKTITGREVSPVKFDSPREARDFAKRYEDISNFEIYGFNNFVYPWINETFREINYDPSMILCYNLDIEVAADSGFPNVDIADKEITAITIESNNKYYVFGCGKYKVEDENVKYFHCRDEHDLLLKFIDMWSSNAPDVITGWNIDYFDIPYLVNRIERILGEGWSKKLSPWGFIDRSTVNMMGRENTVFSIMGVAALDYMTLYKKFTYTPRESYRLDFIANAELGEKKLDYSEYDSLLSLYQNDYQKFITYNIKDTGLVKRLEDKLKLIELVYAIAYGAKINFQDAFTSVRLWDVIAHNHLYNKRQVVPFKKVSRKDNIIIGAYVKPPLVGMHEWEVTLDLASLYPHLIMQYNMSPETIRSHVGNSLGGPDGVDVLLENMTDQTELFALLKEHNLALAASGWTFDRSKQGFLAELMQKYFDERTVYKEKMFVAETELEQVKEMLKDSNDPELVERKRVLENDYSKYYNLQMAVKIILNSAYGSLSNQYFRWYDDRIAESITLSGQLVIKWAEVVLNKYINKIMDTEGEDYVVAIDTDSCIITLGPLVNKFVAKGTSIDEIIKLVDQIVKDKLEPLIDKEYARLSKLTNAYAQKMKMKREVIADRGIHLAKKKYILNVRNNEGVQYSEPKLKMMGIEAIKSSTPSACREAITEALKIIMRGNEKEVQDYIVTFKKKFSALPFEEIAFPRGVNGLQKYADPKTIYKGGCPIHVRGALLYNNLLREKQLTNKFEKIQEGDKIKFAYMKVPNPIKENVISVSGSLPRQLGLESFVDIDMQFQKSFIDPIKSILEVIGWETETRFKIDDFFS
jgi:DNA polymerase elongation subunit (family B)